jgi:fucose permease|eukprot:COSAG01_NODE_433_length_17113_cov_23.009757_17_plen_108_part_00
MALVRLRCRTQHHSGGGSHCWCRYQRDQLNFSQAEQANYLTFAGVKIIIGGLLGKPLMGKLGQLGLTTFSNAVNFCAQAIGMLATGPLGMYAHVLATGIGERKRDGE